MALIYIYIIISAMLTPLARLYLKLRVRKAKEDPIRYVEKLAEISIERPKGQLIWMHASSVGEINILIPLIKAMNKQSPDLHFLITSVTTSSHEIFEKSILLNTIHQYAPIDIPSIVKKFIEYWHPDLAVFAESEIWPNMLLNARAACPTVLINARLSDRSFRRWKKIKSSMTAILKLYSAILPGTGIDKERFEYFHSTNIVYLGNLKDAAPPISFDKKILLKLENSLQGRPVVVYASTHRGEEEIILNAHDELKRDFRNLLTVIVPRHIERVAEITHLLNRHHINYALHSNAQGECSEKDEVYIVNTMGDLGTFYRISDIAFVGGSLIKRGGHNVLEPAKLGLAVITGPHTFNFTEIIQKFIENNAIIVVRDEKELISSVYDLLIEGDYLDKMQKNAHSLSNRQGKSMQHTIEYLMHLL